MNKLNNLNIILKSSLSFFPKVQNFGFVFLLLYVTSQNSQAHVQFDDRWQSSKEETLNELHIGLSPNYEPMEGESLAPQSLWRFDFQYSHFQSKTQNSDRGYDLGMSFEVRTVENWIFGAGFGFGHSNLEKITTTEPKATIGYSFLLSPKGTADFEKSLDVKITASSLNYKQGIDPQTGSTTTSNSDYRFSTRGWTLDLGFNLVEWMSFNLIFTKYLTEADWSNRISSADGGLAVARARRAWSESLSRIVSDYRSANFNFTLSPTIDLSTTYSQAVTAVNKNTSHDLCVEIDKNFTDSFRAGIGIGSTKSESGSNSYGIIYLGYTI